MLPIRTILHPTDFSEPADAAFRLACALARDTGARLIVLHVVTPPVVFYGEGMVPPPALAGYEAELRERLQRVMAPDPKVKIERRMVEGGPTPEILQTAEQTKADLIVMGTHGRTGLGRLLMGSVAEQVVRRAACPVLTVKTPQATAPMPGELSTATAGARA